MDIRELLNGYRDRIRRIALFEPLNDLERKREIDLNGTKIDMKGLGLLTLLFFFEQKLLRNHKTGVKELASFLKETTKQVYVLKEETYEEVARTLIQNFRPAHGKKRSYDYFDWEEKVEETIEYSILKGNDFDSETNTQFYTLDEDGLELIFATKEFYSEFQLSINQLILRKQLEKGEFKGALRQINEMRVAVETLQERIIKLKHEIQRSIVSEETFERFKGLLDDIYNRLEREEEEFKELQDFVKDTKDRLFAENVHQKEQKTYNYILLINRELEKVHYEHSQLLNQTLNLKNTTLITAQESLYYTGMNSFNFDLDIVSFIVSTPFPMETMKGVLHPFLKVEENELWSPLTILEEQNIVEERKEKVEYHFYEVVDENNLNPYKQWLTEKYKELMEHFLQAYEENNGNTLSQFMTYLEKKQIESLFHERYFYDFWIALHQRSPIKTVMNDEETRTVFDEAFRLVGLRTLIVKEDKTKIQKVERYSISEMNIKLEEEDEIF